MEKIDYAELWAVEINERCKYILDYFNEEKVRSSDAIVVLLNSLSAIYIQNNSDYQKVKDVMVEFVETLAPRLRNPPCKNKEVLGG